MGKLRLPHLVVLVGSERCGRGNLELQPILEGHPNPLGRSLVDGVAVLLLSHCHLQPRAVRLCLLPLEDLVVQVHRHRMGGRRLIGRLANLSNEYLLAIDLERDAAEPLCIVCRGATITIGMRKGRRREFVLPGTDGPRQQRREAGLRVCTAHASIQWVNRQR